MGFHMPRPLNILKTPPIFVPINFKHPQCAWNIKILSVTLNTFGALSSVDDIFFSVQFQYHRRSIYLIFARCIKWACFIVNVKIENNDRFLSFQVARWSMMMIVGNVNEHGWMTVRLWSDLLIHRWRSMIIQDSCDKRSHFCAVRTTQYIQSLWQYYCSCLVVFVWIVLDIFSEYAMETNITTMFVVNCFFFFFYLRRKLRTVTIHEPINQSLHFEWKQQSYEYIAFSFIDVWCLSFIVDFADHKIYEYANEPPDQSIACALRLIMCNYTIYNPYATPG